MRYVDFSNVIRNELLKNSPGLTWGQLKERLNLPYDRPCSEWVNRMEEELGLTRVRGTGRALVWKLRPENSRQRKGKRSVSNS